MDGRHLVAGLNGAALDGSLSGIVIAGSAYHSGKSEGRMQMHETEYRSALEACRDGRFTEELRALYRMPERERVPWALFPDWARPTDPVEGGHEGGRI